MAARRAGDLDWRQPERVDRRFRPSWAEAPDRRTDGQRRAALRRRLLIPFLSYHAMALSEDGRLAEARPKIERSVALNPKNAHGAHGFAHVCYESGEPETARAFLLPWLAAYPRDGFFYGHLSWHLSLVEIALGHTAEAQDVYRHAIELGRHSGGPQQKVS